MGLQIMKITSEMEVVPRYRLPVHCLHCFHCMHACISYTHIQCVFLLVYCHGMFQNAIWMDECASE